MGLTVTNYLAVGSLVMTAVGVVAVYHRLRTRFDRAESALVTALVLGATPLFGAALTSSLVDTTVFAAVAVACLAATRLAIRRGASTAIWIALLVAPAVVVMIAQRPRVGVLDALFSPASGLLSLTPVVYIAVIGMAAYGRHEVAPALATLAALVIWPWVGAPLLGIVALTAPGLAAVVNWACRKPLLAVAPLVVFAFAWNYWLMVQYTAGMIPKDAPVSFATLVRQQADVHTRAPYVYPFAFPANVYFAWREGVPIARYDALAVEPRRDSIDMVFDRAADRFLLDGWGPLTSSASGVARGLNSDRATLVFRLAAADRNVGVRIIGEARHGPSATPLEMTVLVNDVVVGRIDAAPGEPFDRQITMPRAVVGATLRAGYNRLTIVTHGSARVAIHRIRISPIA